MSDLTPEDYAAMADSYERIPPRRDEMIGEPVLGLPARRFRELEVVELLRDLPAEGLVAGARGAIAHVYRCGEHCEVEFFTADGRTITVATVEAQDLRPRGEVNR